MKIPTLIFGLYLLLFLGIIPLKTKSQTGSLEVWVHCWNGNGIAGAIISVGNLYIDTTGANGYVFFSEIPVGAWDVTCLIEGYPPMNSTVIIEEGITTQGDFGLPCPEFIVDPLNIEVILEPNAQTTETITLSNPGQGSVEWTAELEIFPPANAEDFLDAQFQYPILNPNGQKGIECDGEYFYVTSINEPISKYALDGTFIETLSISFSGSDLAFNGTYFYGSTGSITIFEMDFYAQVLVSTFTAPGNVRAIAYNHDEDIFYGYSWGGDIIAFDPTGALLGVAPVGLSGANYSGFAYDNASDGSPYLWGYGLVGTDPNTLVQIELPTLQETGFTISLSTLLPEPLTNGAGGLFTHPDIIPGYWTLGGLVTDEWIWGLELAEYETWISIEPTSGTLAPGESEEMTVYFDASNLFPWTYEAEIQFSTLPNVGSPVVDVSMIIEGEPWVQNLQTEISCTNIILNWETVPPSMPADSFHVYRDSLLLATTFDTHFVDSLIFPETEYTYYATGYFYNGWESYPTNDVNVTVPTPDDLEPVNLEVTIINDSILCFYWETNACLLPETYNLYRNGELIAVLTEPSYCDTLPMPGFIEYYITATYYFGESGPSETYYYLWVDASNVTYEKEIRIYPNPANDKLFIESSTAIIQLELLNIQGSIVISENSGLKEIQLDVSGLDPGIYFLKLETSEGIILRKVAVK